MSEEEKKNHKHTLGIRAFLTIVSLWNLSLLLVFVAEQAGLSLTWLQTPKTGFLLMRLILYRTTLKVHL